MTSVCKHTESPRLSTAFYLSGRSSSSLFSEAWPLPPQPQPPSSSLFQILCVCQWPISAFRLLYLSSTIYLSEKYLCSISFPDFTFQLAYNYILRDGVKRISDVKNPDLLNCVDSENYGVCRTSFSKPKLSHGELLPFRNPSQATFKNILVHF